MGGAHPARRVLIWHRDGTVEPCSELPFSPALCLQRKGGALAAAFPCALQFLAALALEAASCGAVPIWPQPLATR